MSFPRSAGLLRFVRNDGALGAAFAGVTDCVLSGLGPPKAECDLTVRTAEPSGHTPLGAAQDSTELNGTQ